MSQLEIEAIVQGQKKDLMGADLAGLDLSGANLAQANLK